MYPDKKIIPYFLYNDDFEINNPLSSHAGTHSVCNIYYSFPSLPRRESKLNNVYLAGIIKSSDIKVFGNQKCFRALIDELQFLEVNGIDIKTKNGEIQRIHFILGLVLGDNLGLNSFLDFNKSFSSNSFCRFCKVKKCETQALTTENQDLMRNISNYEDDIQLHDPSETGIRNISQLNNLPSFHVVENYCIDVMHDIFEGICHYDFCHILQYFIGTVKYFNLETLNSRKKNFAYGSIEIDNMSGEIKLKHINNKRLKMTAREMMSFTFFFPIMVGDLVPDDDEVWKFVLNLVEIVDLILCFEISDKLIYALKNKIKMHNSD